MTNFNEKKKVEIRFRTGIESFDNDFRRKVYNKNIFLDEKKIKELSEKNIFSLSIDSNSRANKRDDKKGY